MFIEHLLSPYWFIFWLERDCWITHDFQLTLHRCRLSVIYENLRRGLSLRRYTNFTQTAIEMFEQEANMTPIWSDVVSLVWFFIVRVQMCFFFSTRLRWVSSSATLVCDERSGASALLVCSVFKRQPWQLHKDWELKQGSRCYFPGTERLSRIDQQWVCHKSVNLSPIRSL